MIFIRLKDYFLKEAKENHFGLQLDGVNPSIENVLAKRTPQKIISEIPT